MKLAVSALASILPQGEGIEVFNHIIYEGLPVKGQFSEKYHDSKTLLAELVKQLTVQQSASDSEINIVLGSIQYSGFENSDTLYDALILAKEYLSHSIKRVNIFALQNNQKNKPSVSLLDNHQDFAFAEDFDFSKDKQSSCFALALTLQRYQEETESYFALLESCDNLEISHRLKDISISVLESTAHSSEEELRQDFDISSPMIPDQLTIALGSVATSIGYTSQHLDMAAFVKTILQCNQRYIAGVPNWQNKNNGLPWQHSNFYISEQSKSWFVDKQDTPRYCLLNIYNKQARQQLLVSDRGLGLERKSHYFSYASPHFFPLAGNGLEDFQKQLQTLSADIKSCTNYICLRALAKSYYQRLIDEEDAINIKKFRAVVLGESEAILTDEIELLLKSLPQAFGESAKHEIKTPKGSYFTAEPLGEEGKVAFVFPGLGSSYVGLGQKIFQLFPSIFKESFRFTDNVGEELQEKVLYPRTQDALSFKEKRQKDMEIVLNLKDLGKTDTTYSSICAHVMTDVFKVHPDMAFGYSMGEANMMTALDVWQTPTELENRFKKSDIFKDRLYGELKTVKQFWGENNSTHSENLWTTFTLKASREAVESYIQSEKLNRVYITLINTDDNLVIAGDPKQCLLLLEKLGSRAIPMGFLPAIHCEPTAQEYEGIAELYSMPTNETCSTKLYSSSCYLPVPVRQKAIAYAIAKCFCEPVDFPRLVNKVYHDGARIFLEAGAGRICSTWIDKILHDKKHVIVPLNAKGSDDSLTFARVMAKLFCHKVEMSLAPLYENV